MASAPKQNQTQSGEQPVIMPKSTDSNPNLGSQPPARGFCEAPQRLEGILKTLANARGSNILIVIKGHPDPDSIASAIAQRHLAAGFDIQSTIVFFDQISHPENRALVKSLDADLRQYREDMDLSAFDYMSFVDTQTTDLPVHVENKPPVLTLVDHHKTVSGVEAEFMDVREDAGATSSIYAEYLEHSAYGLSLGEPAHARLATALMHGIRADTDNLLLARPIDYRAYNTL